jgi:hypothetical protein
MTPPEIAPTGRFSHTAIISTQNYSENDGKFANNPDARALSLGWSTYDQSEISAKVWRRDFGKPWTRGEELPLHRALDLSIMIVAAMIAMKTGILESPYLDLLTVNESELERFFQDIETQSPELEERFHELKLMLLKYNNIHKTP